MTDKLWVLRPIEPKPEPWNNAYDSMHGIVVRAKSPRAARVMAQKVGMDEVWIGGEVWLDPKLTSCERVRERGPEGPIMADVRAK